MQRILFSSMMLVAGTAQAQVTLMENDLLPIGSTAQYKGIGNLTAIDTTNQAANATWDLSGLTPGGTDIEWQFMAPASTPHGADFPTANYARFSTNDNYYDYFNRTSQYLDLVGFWGPTVNTVTYSDPQREMVFPMTIGTTNSDTWANTLSSFDGTYTIEGLGSGTLILPSGTFQNVFMMRSVQTELLPVPIYSWHSADNGAYLLIYMKGDGFFYPTVGWYLDEVSVGVREHTLMAGSIRQNPITDLLQVDVDRNFQGYMEWMITNNAGQLVLQGSIMIAEGHKQLQVDMSSVPAGMYHLTMVPRDQQIGPLAMKVVKQ